MAASGLSWFETREDALLTMTIGALPRVRQPELPPAAVQPQPLIRIFADPALDHRGDRLHRSLNVDLAGGVAHRLHFLRQFGAETMAGQADDADAVDRALDLPQQPR